MKMTSLCVFCLVCTSSLASAEDLVDYPEPSGVLVNNGWDSFLGRKTSDICVMADSFRDAGQRSVLRFEEVTDASSLASSLQVSANVKLASVFGGSASASMDFTRSANIESSGSNVSVFFQIIDGAVYSIPKSDAVSIQSRVAAANASGPTLKTDITPEPVAASQGSISLYPKYRKLSRTKPIEFRKRCGDSFVSARRSGAGLIGLASAYSRTDKERTEFKGALSASFGTFSGDAKVQSSLATMQSEGRVNIVYSRWGTPSLTVAQSVDQFKALLKSVSESANAAVDSPYQIGITRYNEISGPQSPSGGASQLNALVDQYFRLETLRLYLLRVHNNPGLFIFDDNVTQESASKLATHVHELMAELHDGSKGTLDSCAKMVSKSKTCLIRKGLPVDDYDLRAGLPLLKSAAQALFDKQGALAEQSASEAALATIPTTITNYDHCDEWLFGVCQRRSPRQVENPDYGPAKTRLDRAKVAVNAIGDVGTIDQIRYRVLVDDVNLVRCTKRESACVSTARLDSIREKMTSRS